jgi:hypothetical protein
LFCRQFGEHTITPRRARVVELVDTLALGASAARREGSSPFSRTNIKSLAVVGLFILLPAGLRT